MKKTNTWKRMAAGVLSLALVAGMLPANVGGFLTGSKEIVAKASEPSAYVTSFSQLKAAIDGSVETIELGNDINVTETLEIGSESEVCIDLNGNTLSFSGKENQGIDVKRNAKLRIQDSTNGIGRITIGDNAGDEVILANSGSLVIENGTFDIEIRNKGTLLVKNGTFNNTVDLDDAEKCTIKDGTFNGEINVNTGKPSIVGGNFLSTIAIDAGWINTDKYGVVKLQKGDKWYNTVLKTCSESKTDDVIHKLDGNVIIDQPITLQSGELIINGNLTVNAEITIGNNDVGAYGGIIVNGNVSGGDNAKVKLSNEACLAVYTGELSGNVDGDGFDRAHTEDGKYPTKIDSVWIGEIGSAAYLINGELWNYEGREFKRLTELFKYQFLYGENCGDVRFSDFSSGDTIKVINETTLDFPNGTNAKDKAQILFKSDKNITITAPKGKLIAAIVLSGDLLEDSSVKGINDLEVNGSDADYILDGNQIAVRNVLSNQAKLSTTGDGIRALIDSVQVIYVDPIQVRNEEILHQDYYFTPSLDEEKTKYWLDVKFRPDNVVAPYYKDVDGVNTLIMSESELAGEDRLSYEWEYGTDYELLDIKKQVVNEDGSVVWKNLEELQFENPDTFIDFGRGDKGFYVTEAGKYLVTIKAKKDVFTSGNPDLPSESFYNDAELSGEVQFEWVVAPYSISKSQDGTLTEREGFADLFTEEVQEIDGVSHTVRKKYEDPNFTYTVQFNTTGEGDNEVRTPYAKEFSYDVCVEAAPIDPVTGEVKVAEEEGQEVTKTKLVKGTDYEIVKAIIPDTETDVVGAVSAKNVNKYKVTIRGIGNYAGAFEKSWFINQAGIEKADYEAPKNLTEKVTTDNNQETTVGVPLYFNGNAQTLIEAGVLKDTLFVENVNGLVAPKFQYKLVQVTEEDGNTVETPVGDWQDTVPKATGEAGKDVKYKVYYRIAGGSEFKNLPLSAEQEQEQALGSVDVNITRKPTTVQLTDLEGSVVVQVVKGENDSDVEQKIADLGVDDVLAVKATDKFKIYTNKTIPTTAAGIVDTTVETKKDYNGTTYEYCYTINIPEVPADKPENQKAAYLVSHTFGTKVISAESGSEETDKAYVIDENEVNSQKALIASFTEKEGEDKDTYYYGDAPTKKDVNLVQGNYGATVEVTSFSYYLTGDSGQTLLNKEQLEAGNDYTVIAYLKVTFANGSSTNAYITKPIHYVARPLTECEVYLKSGENEIPLTIDKQTGSVTINEENAFTYNKSEQKPEIVIKNSVYGETVNLTVADYTDNLEAKTDATTTKGTNNTDVYTAGYSAVLTGKDKNYTGDLTVNWGIKQAENSLEIAPKTDIVYDGKNLDITDFNVTDPNGILSGGDSTVQAVVSSYNESDIKNAGEGKAVIISVTSKNYKEYNHTLNEITISPREVNVTPDANQSVEYGITIGEIKYDLEKANGNRGVLEADLTNEQISKWAVKVGDSYNYSDGAKNDVGTYGYMPNTFNNYVLTIVGADTNKFTVEPKDISNFKVELAGDTDGKDAATETDGTLYYTYDGETNFKVKVVNVTGDNNKYNLTADDYNVQGAYQRITAGNYTVQVEGKGNYKGIATADWKVVAAAVDGVVLKVGELTDENNVFAANYNSKAFEANVDMTAAPNDFKKNVTSQIVEYYDGATKLDGAPKNAGTYTVKAVVKATGYADVEIVKTLEIVPVGLKNNAETMTLEFGKAPIADGEDGYTKLTADMIDSIEGITDTDKTMMKEAVADGKLGFNWEATETKNLYAGTIVAKGDVSDDLSAVLEKNYNWTNAGFKLNVIPKSIKSSDIEITYAPTMVLGEKTTDEGWTTNEVIVKDKTTGQTLKEGKDFVVNNNNTKQAGNFKIEVVGQGNYNQYVEKKWTVTEDFSAIYQFAKDDASVAINPANKGIYVKLRFTGEKLDDNYKVVEYGVIYNNDGSVTDISKLTFETAEENEAIVRMQNKNGFNVRDYGKGVTAVGYVIIENVYGDQTVLYSPTNIGGDTYVCTESEPSAVVNPANGDGYVKVHYEGNIYKKGYSVTEYGLIYNNTGEASVADLTLDNVNGTTIIQIKDKNGANLRDTGKGVVAVGYMKVKNAEGLEAYIYTNDLGGSFDELNNNNKQ